MPCGGIQPIKPGGGGDVRTQLSPTKGGCWVCQKGGCHHFMHEWDTYIHAVCAIEYLATEEAQILIGHKHSVFLDFGLEEEFK